MSCKSLHVAAIPSGVCRDFIRREHYSGRCVQNAQLNIGVFWSGALAGAMQFGPPLARSKVIGLVSGTRWNGFLELNRVAFSESLPRNSESRALSVVFRMMRKHRPDIEWILSFADGTQCGDGTIYRAAGFVLTAIKPNTGIVVRKDGSVGSYRNGQYNRPGIPLAGFQLRYVYFLNPDARERLTVPVLPFSEIDKLGAGMYKGKRRAGSTTTNASGHQPEDGGSTPTPALQIVK